MHGKHKSKAGFTMIELMVALSLALMVGFAVFFMYVQSIEAYATAEAELRFLIGFRASTDFVEREVNSMCWKAGYLPASGGGTFKPVNGGLFRTHFSDRCMVFYTSLDGVHIDRVAYYHNPPEDQLVWEDGFDNDGDDPQPVLNPLEDSRFGMYLLRDDKGSFMRRKWLDAELEYEAYANPYLDGLPDFVGGMLQYDLGDIMADGFSDIEFSYLYALPGDGKLYYADCWPYEKEDTNNKADETGLAWGGVGLSYLTVPLGVQIDFHYNLEGADRVLSKLMFIYSSKWQELTSQASG